VTVTARDQVSGTAGGDGGTVVFLDLDTVLLSTHPGRYGPELGVQADVTEAIDRFAEIADTIVVLVNPPVPDSPHAVDTDHRLTALRSSLGVVLDRLIIVTCPHGEADSCDCSKPGHGLIEHLQAEHSLSIRGGWYVGGDQEGVVCGRTAGLHTIRVGPVGEDHLSAVHRADFEVRDLLDAANHVLMESLAA